MKSDNDMVGEKSRVHGGGGYGQVGICHIESEMVLMSLSKTLWTAEISGFVPSVCILINLCSVEPTLVVLMYIVPIN